MKYCRECTHSMTYHNLGRDEEGYPKVQCASWGCDCPGFVAADRKPENYKERPKWNT